MWIKCFSMRNQVTYTGLTVVNLHVPVVPMCLCIFPTVLPFILATVLKFALPTSHPPNKKVNFYYKTRLSLLYQ